MPDAPDEQNAPSTSDDLGSRLRAVASERSTLIIALGATVGGAALLCVFIFLLLRAQLPTQAEETPTPEAVRPADTDEFTIEVISESGTISVTLETPVFVNIGGQEFSVEPVTVPESGPWSPSPSSETTAVWVFGSIVNYIFGLDDTQDNRALLDSLELGNEVVLTGRSGSQLTFAVSSREMVSSDNRDIFAQRAPAVTLVMVDDDPEAERLVVRGEYVVSTAGSSPEAGRVVELGQTAQLDDLQITATSSSYLAGRVEAPPGFAFLLIDYQAENVGVTSLNSASLSMVLADDNGNLYAPNAAASQLGNYRPLSGTIGPGQNIAATVGYQIPVGLTSPSLNWQVTNMTTGSGIQVTIPFQNIQQAGQQVNVQVQQAQVSADGTSLLIIGQATNLGEQPVVIDVDVVTLTSEGTLYLMLSTNPAFPWVISPGQILPFQVTFQRPSGSSAIFTVLNNSFQLSGLR